MEYVNPGNSSSATTAALNSLTGAGDDGGDDGGGGGDVVWVYWRTPEEWAALIEDWVEETAQKGTVLTLYELSQGEDTIGTGKSYHITPPPYLYNPSHTLLLQVQEESQKLGQKEMKGQDKSHRVVYMR